MLTKGIYTVENLEHLLSSHYKKKKKSKEKFAFQHLIVDQAAGIDTLKFLCLVLAVPWKNRGALLTTTQAALGNPLGKGAVQTHRDSFPPLSSRGHVPRV